MKKTSRSRGYSIAVTIVAFVLILGIPYGAFLLILRVFDAAQNIDSGIVVSTIPPAIALVGSVIAIRQGKLKELEMQIADDLRSKKTPVYVDFVKFLMKLQSSHVTGVKMSEKEITDFLIRFNEEMMVWASDEVLSAWVKWREVLVLDAKDTASPGAEKIAKRETNALRLLIPYEELLYAIRRDLGHHNRGLSRGDLLSLTVNDVRDHL